MKCRHFIEAETSRTIVAMRELMSNLRSLPVLASRKVDYPSMVNSNPVKLTSELERELFVSIGTKIKHFTYQNRNWEGEWLSRLPELDYLSMSSFSLDSVKYIAAGYRTTHYRGRCQCGIEITNLKHNENKSIIVNVNSEKGFNSLGIINSGHNISYGKCGSILIAAHSDLGVIGVPLDELVRNECVKIDSSSENYFILKKEKKDREHIRVKTVGDLAYITKGREVYMYSASECKIVEKRSISNLSSIETITALDLDTNHNLYLAVTNGNILKNNYIFYRLSDLPIITRIKAGNYDCNEGVFIMGRPSPVYFVDGNGHIIVSPIDKRVIDFGCNVNKLFFLTNNGVFIRGNNSSNNTEIKEGWLGDRVVPKWLYVEAEDIK